MKKLQPQSKPSTLAQPSPSSASPDSCNQGVEGFQVIQDDNSSVKSSSSPLVTTPTPTNDTTISKPFLKPDGKWCKHSLCLIRYTLLEHLQIDVLVLYLLLASSSFFERNF